MNNYFVGIGVAKAGTTWLSEYFKLHPEICISPVKEIHYFDEKFFNSEQKIKRKRIEDLKKMAEKMSIDINEGQIFRLKQLLFLIEIYTNSTAYHKYFNWLNKNGKICGEITPKYALLPERGFVEMRKFLHNPKVILMLRNPIDRYWSQIRFHKNFIPNINLAEYYLHSFNKHNVISHSYYQNILPTVFRVFDRTNVHVVFYEHLFDDNLKENELKSICEFLEVNFIKPEIYKRINSSVSVVLIDKLRITGIKKLMSSYKYVIENFNNTPKNWIEDLSLI